MQLENYTVFLAGKQNQTSFQTRPPMRRKMPLELMHTDVCYVDTVTNSIKAEKGLVLKRRISTIVGNNTKTGKD